MRRLVMWVCLICLPLVARAGPCAARDVASESALAAVIRLDRNLRAADLVTVTRAGAYALCRVRAGTPSNALDYDVLLIRKSSHWVRIGTTLAGMAPQEMQRLGFPTPTADDCFR